MKLYIFIRENTFYPIELRDDDDARKNAEWNPGTVRVEDILGRQIWPTEQDNAVPRADVPGSVVPLPDAEARVSRAGTLSAASPGASPPENDNGREP